MEKYVYFGLKEEVIECDIDITYERFLSKIQETFNLKENTFNIVDLTEDNFDQMMTIKDDFIIKKYKKGLIYFDNMNTFQEAEDFLLIYGFKLDKYRVTPLHTSARNGKIGLVKLILEKNFDDVHRTDNNGRTPLYWAVLGGNIDIIKLLLEQNFDNVFQTDNLDRTLIYTATLHGHTNIVRLLLEQNFDNAHQSNKYNETPLQVSIDEHYPEIQELLENDIERRRQYHFNNNIERHRQYHFNKESTCRCLLM